MSFINKLANNSLLDNVTINNQLNVGDEINTQDLVISRKITLLPEAELDGNFLKTFTDNDEEIDLYEKISRIDAKNDANTVLHANNASAIATRYTKGETDSYLEHIYSKEDVDVLLIDPRFQTTDDNLLTFYG